MSLAVLASGTLVRDPEARVSAAGKRYATALLRVPSEGEDAVLVSVVAYSNTALEARLAHERGDSIAVTGRAKLTSWEKGGEQRHGISVVAEAVLSPYQVGRRKQRTRGEAGGDGGATPEAPAAELERVARAQAARGTAQVLTRPAARTGGLAEMEDYVPF